MAIFNGAVFERKHIGKISIPGLLARVLAPIEAERRGALEGGGQLASAERTMALIRN
jgi:hypothetical protein